MGWDRLYFVEGSLSLLRVSGEDGDGDGERGTGNGERVCTHIGIVGKWGEGEETKQCQVSSREEHEEYARPMDNNTVERKRLRI